MAIFLFPSFALTERDHPSWHVEDYLTLIRAKPSPGVLIHRRGDLDFSSELRESVRYLTPYFHIVLEND
jgi:hypothetical protein